MLLAKACPGLFHHATITAYDYIRDHLPLSQGQALLHAAAILEGEVMVWPDPKLSKRGRWWLKVKQLFKRPPV